jgi:hypothetical protein
MAFRQFGFLCVLISFTLILLHGIIPHHHHDSHHVHETETTSHHDHDSDHGPFSHDEHADFTPHVHESEKNSHHDHNSEHGPFSHDEHADFTPGLTSRIEGPALTLIDLSSIDFLAADQLAVFRIDLYNYEKAPPNTSIVSVYYQSCTCLRAPPAFIS